MLSKTNWFGLGCWALGLFMGGFEPNLWAGGAAGAAIGVVSLILDRSSKK